jgi:hypothetical protein
VYYYSHPTAIHKELIPPQKENRMIHSTTIRTDEAMRKGAVEHDALYADCGPGHNSFAGQLGHRDQDEMLKDNDTDFPEPDAHGEHTGR